VLTASFDDLMDFAGSLDSVDRVEAAVRDHECVLFDLEWTGDFRSKLTRAMTGDAAKLLRTNHPGIIVATQAVGNMGTTNELLVKSSRLRGTPIIDAPTSWQYFVWKLEYDAQTLERRLGLTDLHVVHALQLGAHDKMEWLGKGPPAALIELRKAGALDEIRHILSRGVQELALAEPTDFQRTSNQVLENIDTAFAEHKKNIEELRRKKWKFAGTEIGSWVVVGSLAIAAAATGHPLWGIAAWAADQILPAPKFREIPKSIRKLVRQDRNLKQSPVGILFKYRYLKT